MDVAVLGAAVESDVLSKEKIYIDVVVLVAAMVELSDVFSMEIYIDVRLSTFSMLIFPVDTKLVDDILYT